MAEVPAIEPIEQVTLPPIRPGVGWYVLGGAVIGLGLAAAFLLLTAGAFGYLGAIDDLPRTAVPGEDTVELDAGEVVVFHEPEGGVLGSVATLGLTVHGPDGQALELGPSDRGDRYATRDRRGVGVARFVAPQTGRYEVASTSGTGTLAVGASPRRGLTRFGPAASVTAVVALGAGIVVLVVTARRRGRAKLARIEIQRSVRPVERLE